MLRIASLVVVLLVIFIFYEYKTKQFYQSIPTMILSDAIRNAKTGDLLFTKQHYGFPTFSLTMLSLGALQFAVTKIPYSHVAIIIKHADIPEEYRLLWNISDNSADTSDTYVYSSESSDHYDIITGQSKQGTSMRDLSSYIQTYNGKVVHMPALEPVTEEGMRNMCAFMHNHRYRLFNKNMFRYFNLGPKIWENVYNPAESLCTETCAESLKKLGTLDVFRDSGGLNSSTTGLLEIYNTALQSNRYAGPYLINV